MIEREYELRDDARQHWQWQSRRMLKFHDCRNGQYYILKHTGEPNYPSSANGSQYRSKDQRKGLTVHDYNRFRCGLFDDLRAVKVLANVGRGHRLRTIHPIRP